MRELSTKYMIAGSFDILLVIEYILSREKLI